MADNIVSESITYAKYLETKIENLEAQVVKLWATHEVVVVAFMCALAGFLLGHVL